MTTVYFVRHAQPDYSDAHEEPEYAPLTAQGRQDAQRVCEFLADRKIDAIFSSPYPRAWDTVEPLSHRLNLPIRPMEDFRERTIGAWLDDFNGYAKHQWEDFSYSVSDGENLHQVQQRAVAALQGLLKEHSDQILVIGGHGTCISTILHHYDPLFGFDGFSRIKSWMPWVVRLRFEGMRCLDRQDLFWIKDRREFRRQEK